MALTKHLVELHGGNIEVESALDMGSTFRVCVPILPTKKLVNNNLTYASCPIVAKPKRVILITQDDEIATFICQLLTAAEYKVVWLIDPMSAIDRIDFLEPQIVILDRDSLDIEIPDVADTIKTLEKIDRTKIILLYSQMKDREWTYLSQNGVCDRLLKSMDLSGLLTKIERLI